MSSGKTLVQDLKKDILRRSNVKGGVVVLPKASPRQRSGKNGIPIDLGGNSVETVICGMENPIKILHSGKWEGSNGSNMGGEYGIKMLIKYGGVSAIVLWNSIGCKKVPSGMMFG